MRGARGRYAAGLPQGVHAERRGGVPGPVGVCARFYGCAAAADAESGVQLRSGRGRRGARGRVGEDVGGGGAGAEPRCHRVGAGIHRVSANELYGNGRGRPDRALS